MQLIFLIIVNIIVRTLILINLLLHVDHCLLSQIQLGALRRLLCRGHLGVQADSELISHSRLRLNLIRTFTSIEVDLPRFCHSCSIAFISSLLFRII